MCAAPRARKHGEARLQRSHLLLNTKQAVLCAFGGRVQRGCKLLKNHRSLLGLLYAGSELRIVCRLGRGGYARSVQKLHHKLLDVVIGLATLIREAADLRGHYGKAFAMLAAARGLNCCAARQQV